LNENENDYRKGHAKQRWGCGAKSYPVEDFPKRTIFSLEVDRRPGMFPTVVSKAGPHAGRPE
jgi:hypothetical protein